MPSFDHEIVIHLIRDHAELVRDLLHACTAIEPRGIAEPASIDLSQVAPAEYRADSITVFRDDDRVATLAVIVEVQRNIDPSKLRTWPVYVTCARASLRCPTVLLVVTSNEDVARWASTPIATGHPGFTLRPIVVAPASMPRVVDHEVARRSPALAVLSALAHPELEVAAAALAGIHTLAEDEQQLYFDTVMRALSAVTRCALEVYMQRYEYKSEFALRYLSMGRAEGIQRAVIELARIKLGELTADEEAAIRELRDEDVLSALNSRLGAAADREQARVALMSVIAPQR